MVLPDRNNFSIISKLLLAGPRVASCFVAFLNLIGSTVIPIEGSTITLDIEIADLEYACLHTEDLVTRLKENPAIGNIHGCTELAKKFDS